MDKQYLDKSTDTSIGRSKSCQTVQWHHQQRSTSEVAQRLNIWPITNKHLGGALGSRLYEVVSDLFTMDQMVRYGKDLADSLLMRQSKQHLINLALV